MYYLLNRLAQGLVVILMALTLGFLLVFVIGDPVLMRVGGDASPELIERYRVLMGLDRPLYIQYGEFMWNALQGDFGVSYRNSEPVMPQLVGALSRSAEVAIPAVILALAVSIPVGVISAVKRNSATDYVARVFALVGQAAPQFWVAIMMIVIFAVALGWMPVSGRVTDQGIGTYLAHVAMPAFVLGLTPMAYLTRMMRSTVLEVINQDYIRTAYAKGLSKPRIIYVHAVRNAMVPYVTLSALQIGNVIAGSMVVESVFAWPGLGRLFMGSIRQLDIPMVAGGLAMVALIYVVLNLIADLSYTLLDPRVRQG
ncbi:MAG: ABC transporter permease [Halofilum sp. (in: g-proteobacteria)]